MGTSVAHSGSITLKIGFTSEDHQLVAQTLDLFDRSFGHGEVPPPPQPPSNCRIEHVEFTGRIPCPQDELTARAVLVHDLNRVSYAVAHVALVSRVVPMPPYRRIGGLCALCVDPLWRGLGFGRYLLQTSTWLGWTVGYKYVLGWIVEDMADFYSRCGLDICPNKRRICYRYPWNPGLATIWEEAESFDSDW